MAAEKFPLPASSYEELLKIIGTYNTLDKPAAPNEVSRVSGLHRVTVSYNHKFLVATGLLVEQGQKKVIADKGRTLMHAIGYDHSEDIKRNWRDIVLDNEFLKGVLSAVKIRKGMESSTLQSHIAYSAGRAKTPRSMAGAGAIIDILQKAELIKDMEGKLVAVSEVEPVDQPIQRVHRLSGDVRAISDASGKVTVTKGMPVTEGIPVSIQIQIQCSADEIEGLASKINSLLREISSTAVSKESDTDRQE